MSAHWIGWCTTWRRRELRGAPRESEKAARRSGRAESPAAEMQRGRAGDGVQRSATRRARSESSPEARRTWLRRGCSSRATASEGPSRWSVMSLLGTMAQDSREPPPSCGNSRWCTSSTETAPPTALMKVWRWRAGRVGGEAVEGEEMEGERDGEELALSDGNDVDVTGGGVVVVVVE